MKDFLAGKYGFILCTTCFMKQLFFFLVIAVFISACSNDNKETKTENISSKDSRSVSPNDSIPETVFKDSVVAVPTTESALLKFNLPQGKVFGYQMNFDMAGKEGEQKMNNAMKWNYNMRVLDEKDGIKNIQTTYKQIEMTMNMGQMKMEFSSEKEVAANDFMQMPSRMFKAIKGKSFTMQVNEKGEILSVTGFDKIGEAMVTEMNLPETSKPMMRKNFQEQFNDDAVKQMFGQFFDVFPNKIVKSGDRWEKKSSVMAAEIEMTTTYTVKNIKDNKVYLSSVAKIQSTDSKSMGTQTGSLVVDAITGLVLDATFNQKMPGGGTSKGRIIGRQL